MSVDNKQVPGPVAIVGLACRFPGDATSPSKFWDLLKSGKDAYSETTDRYNAQAFYHPNSKRQNVLPVTGGHFLKQDPHVFDAAFFNITAAEAISLDPKQRIALEVAYEAFENAGKPLKQVAGTTTACFVGSSMSDYRDAVVRDFAHNPKYHVLGTCEEMIANRISHFFDIHGPSATVHTACSSSLVAIHLACQSLLSGDAEMALAGGVGMILTPDGTMQLNNLGFLNPEGHSRSFDKDAGGYGRGEGCGILVLKKLDKAIQDGDNIRAVIRASGVNSDGWTQGVTMPSSEAQAALIKHVYETRGLDYGATQYVEAHGTGTKAGDPVETGAIHRTIGQGASKNRKLWIGHLEAAAGVASVIKGVLAMENSLIPPNIHFASPNPEIPLDEWNMAVPTKLTPWPAARTKRMSVSGFGMGGTNGHVVLEAFNSTPQSILYGDAQYQPAHNGKRLFTFSSHDQAGLDRVSKSLVDHLDSLGPAGARPEYLADLGYSLSVGKSGLSWKTAHLAESLTELREKLSSPQSEHAVREPRSQPKIGFVFTGQGAQWARMGVEMLHRPVFKESVQRSTDYLQQLGCDWTPIVELSRAQKESRLTLPEISQPICSVLQIALVDELRSWGVAPVSVVGHSSGEIAAAYCIEALSHKDAIAVAYFRGKVSAGLNHLNGGMMAVGCSRAEAETLIDESDLQGGHVTVACVNSPSNVTLSGDVAPLDQLKGILEKRGIFARRLRVEVAYHSTHMNSVFADYTASIADIEPQSCPSHQPIMVSSVTNNQVDPALLGSYYWGRNLISPVLFSDTIKEMVSPADGNGQKAVDLLVEIGPHGALGGPIEQILSHFDIENVGYQSMLTRGQNAVETSLELATSLFLQGVAIDIQKVNGDSGCRLLTNLPPYPWNHSKKFRAESRLQRELIAQSTPTRSIIGAPVPKMNESQRVWRGFIRLDDEPWIRGHTVGTTVLFPGAGMVSIVLEAAQQMVDPGKVARAFRLRDVSFSAAMALPEDQATEVIIQMKPQLVATSGSTPATWWEFTVSSCAGTDQLRDNCRGLITIDYEGNTSQQMAHEDSQVVSGRISDYHQILEECPATYAKDRFYKHMMKAAWRYGETFQGVENCHPGDGKTVFDVKLIDIGETFSKGQLDRPFLIHGATLDAVFQGWLGSTYKNGTFEFDKPFVPTKIGEMEISFNVPSEAGYMMPGLCRSHRSGFNELSADTIMFDKDFSRVILSVIDFRTSELEMDGAATEETTVEVDPADITSKVLWDYSLSLMEPCDLKQVMGSIVAQNRLTDFVRMLLHDNPAANIVEFISRSDGLPNTYASKLPPGTILPTQIRYAVVDETEDVGDENAASSMLTIDALVDSVSASGATADIVVIPQGFQFQDNYAKILEPLAKVSKPNTTIVVAVDTPDTTVPLKAKGFQLLHSIQGAPSLEVFAGLTGEQEKPTNGIHKEEVVLLLPSMLSTVTKEFAEEVQLDLEGQGFSVSTESLAESIDDSTFDGKTCVSLLEVERPLLDSLSESDFQLIRKVVLTSQRILWVTHGESPSLALVDGFSRCIMSEIEGVKFQVLHLSEPTGLQHGPRLAAKVIASKASDNEFRDKDGLLQVARIFKGLTENENIRHHLHDDVRVTRLSNQEHPLRLTIGKPGLLDTLYFVDDERVLAPLADHEVEIQVKATGLNFRDVMASMALVPVKGLGQEASGIVLRTGRDATHLKPGDRVSTLDMGTHATVMRADHRVTVKIPDAMSFEEAAAVPVVHTTAYYALVRLAKLQRGQSVLIHAAAGGVGQAALQLANHLGLVVYATVGSDDKRKLLTDRYQVSEDHIFNSRDASFAKGIMRVTGGRGVDCVLNSLSGELLRVSWSCLATFGTFVEIGLRDITNNMLLDMRPFSKSTTFSFINMYTLFEEDPSALGDILEEVFKLLGGGILQTPSPMTVYPINQVENAFRIMQQGKHRGKIVLSFPDDAQAPVLHVAKNSMKLDSQATYLFVGGLGGLGRSLAKEFVSCGAKNIAFISRSGDSTSEAKATIKEITSRGANVKAYAADISDETAFLNAMKECSREFPPIKGVVQMAMVLRDVVFEKMTYEEWKLPLKPKVQGSWNLHKYFDHERPLDFMVICSSSSGIYGYPSQAQYAAGNTYQDALAHYRRAQGLRAVSVNLGIMRDVGVLAEQGTSGNIKLWEEVLGIREPAFHALMKSLIKGQTDNNSEFPAQICTGLGTADIMATHGLAKPTYFQDPRFGPLAVTSLSSDASGDKQSTAMSISSQLSEASSKAKATEIITNALIGKVADILQMPQSEVDPGQPLYRYGVDSLVALEVRNWITREMKVNVALLEILAAVPMESFAGKLASTSKLVTVS
ncbi:unnamed protein product [Fusarium graminearum]|nr:unnamed protein product [Fusarium graminearum]VTO83365.1 unnamed protein product [Fusarium graminearum]